VEGIKTRKSRRIRKFKRIRTQPLCGEHLLWVLYLFLGRNKGFHYKIKSLVFIIHKIVDIRSLGGCLCVTLLCEKEGEECGRKLYLSFCVMEND
jgi:hypothetical protein